MDWRRPFVGKRPKVALTACMRKLLILCNALCKHETLRDSTMALLDLPAQHSCYARTGAHLGW